MLLRKCLCFGIAQFPKDFIAFVAGMNGHYRSKSKGMRVVPFRIGKYVQVTNVQFLEKCQSFSKGFLCLTRKTHNNIHSNTGVRHHGFNKSCFFCI